MSKVTDFDELKSLDGDEVFYVVKDGKDYHVTFETLKNLIKETEQVVLGDLNW